jgi:hypothetical protein
MGPIGKVAAAENGSFLVGYHGYGEFETCRYQANGIIADRWASHGYYVVRDGDIRIVELGNDGRVTRIQSGGTVVRGALLDGYYTSRPCLTAEGLLLFFRHGLVYAIRDLSISERLPVCEQNDRVFSTGMQVGSACVYVCFTLPQTPPPLQGIGFESYLVRVDF